MKSKITSTPICEIEDDHGNTTLIQPEIDENGGVLNYMVTAGSVDLVFSDPDELSRYGAAIMEYADLAQMRLHDKNNKQ